ncbi:MAG: FIST C-terminal domain-containing protein, partial [Candidatus Sericytochromatia bacterium]|nr:FIST C-terminal domain-containing protein [Candidatus Sericytochromatia bacterium]
MSTATKQSTVASTGQSVVATSADAGRAAAEQALAGLGGRTATLLLAFIAPNHTYTDALAGIQAVFPGCPVIGASTAGEFTERGKTTGGIAILALGSGSMQTVINKATGLRQDPAAVAGAALGEFAATQRAMMADGLVNATVLSFSDGLAGRGEDMVAAIAKQVGLSVQLAGGAAADGGKFAETVVFHDGQATPDTLVTAALFTEGKVGIGVRHGMSPAGSKMKVTKADKTILFELDGKPAFEAYRAFAKERGVELTPETAGSYMIAHELGIHMIGNINKVRAPLSVNPDGSLNLATEIPMNAFVSIMDGGAESLIPAAREAALEAKKNLGQGEAAAVLLIDCICRGIILDTEFQREIDTVREVFGDVPVAGFLTYGEIAKYGGQLNGFHNSTAVVVAI